MMAWGYGPGYGGTFGGFGAMGIIALLIQVLFWGAIIYFGLRLFRDHNSRISTGSRDSYARIEPMDILRERYARGEIDAEEYHRRKEDLQN